MSDRDTTELDDTADGRMKKTIVLQIREMQNALFDH